MMQYEILLYCGIGLAVTLLFVGLIEYFRPHREIDEGKPWIFSYWIKILAFLFLTPLWIILVWTDRTERTSVKIFATLWAGLLVISCLIGALTTFPPGREVRLIASGLGSGMVGFADENLELVEMRVNFPWEHSYRARRGTPIGLVVMSESDFGWSECEIWVGRKMLDRQISTMPYVPAYCKIQVP